MNIFPKDYLTAPERQPSFPTLEDIKKLARQNYVVAFAYKAFETDCCTWEEALMMMVVNQDQVIREYQKILEEKLFELPQRIVVNKFSFECIFPKLYYLAIENFETQEEALIAGKKASNSSVNQKDKFFICYNYSKPVSVNETINDRATYNSGKLILTKTGLGWNWIPDIESDREELALARLKQYPELLGHYGRRCSEVSSEPCHHQFAAKKMWQVAFGLWEKN